jgi:hypothetical protein
VPNTRPFDAGDHACAIYSSRAQLVRLVSRFLAEGLERYEHTWYIGAFTEGRAIVAALRRRGVDVDRQIRQGALRLLLPGEVYVAGGEFDARHADRMFYDAILQSQLHGFRGFRAAAEMSWAMTVPNGPERLIAYEAHSQSGIAAGPVTALCLYHRRRVSSDVLHGAVLTHPLAAASRGHAMRNPLYDAAVSNLPVDNRDVPLKLRTLATLTRQSARRRS